MDFENNLPRVDPIRMTHNGDSVYGRIAIEALLDLLKRIRGAAGFQEKLDLITEGIASCGWRRVHLYIVDTNIGKLKSASSWGLSEKELEHIRSSGMKMEDVEAFLRPEFDKYRIGRSYYFPHNCIDPFAVKMRSRGSSSSLSTEEFLDWNPADLLYFPLVGFDGEIVGVLSVDDPINGKRPNEDSLSIVELFIDAVIGLIEEGEFKDYFSKTRGLLSKLFDLSPTSLLLLDENERIVDANAAALDVLGYEQGELIGQPECGIIASNETYKSILRGRKEGSYRGEVLISGKKGDIWGLFFSVPVFRGDGYLDGYIDHIIDITESKRLQQHLVRAEKLAGIGVLASGIAHEINNPLYAILGLAEHIAGSVSVPENLRSEAEEIVEYTKDAAQIVKDLAEYTYSAQRESEFPVNLNDVIRSAIKLVEHSADVLGIDFKLHLGEIADIKASSSELIQIIVNLIKNSLDAIGDDRGTIIISTFLEENHIFCTIEDNGCGIPEDRLANVFEPFYTTKNVGEGTGLGLYVCYKIVTKSGGNINIKSTQGKGTAVTLEFPL